MKVGYFEVDIKEIDIPHKHYVVTLQHEDTKQFLAPFNIEPIEADILARAIQLHAQSLRVHGQ